MCGNGRKLHIFKNKYKNDMVKMYKSVVKKAKV